MTVEHQPEVHQHDLHPVDGRGAGGHLEPFPPMYRGDDGGDCTVPDPAARLRADEEWLAASQARDRPLRVFRLLSRTASPVVPLLPGNAAALRVLRLLSGSHAISPLWVFRVLPGLSAVLCAGRGQSLLEQFLLLPLFEQFLLLGRRRRSGEPCISPYGSVDKESSRTEEPRYRGLSVSDWTATLKNPYPGIRADAAAALGHLGPQAKNAVPALEEALKDEEAEVRAQAAQALAAIGEEAVQPLTKALSDDNRQMRMGAALALGRMGRKAQAAAPALAEALEDRDISVRCHAAQALWR